jgi:hypothetical protein
VILQPTFRHDAKVVREERRSVRVPGRHSVRVEASILAGSSLCIVEGCESGRRDERTIIVALASTHSRHECWTDLAQHY